jgi:serine/threonine protein kinase
LFIFIQLFTKRPVSGAAGRLFQIQSRLNTLAETYRGIRHRNGTILCDFTDFNKHTLQGIRIKCDSCYNYNLDYEHWQMGQHDPAHPQLVFFSEIVAEVPFSAIRIIGKLASGSFSDVFKACVSDEDNLVALKVITNARASQVTGGGGGQARLTNGGLKMSLQESIQSIENELDAHREIRSAYLCKLFGYAMVDGRASLLLEFMDYGNLVDVLRKEAQGKNFCLEIFIER